MAKGIVFAPQVSVPLDNSHYGMYVDVAGDLIYQRTTGSSPINISASLGGSLSASFLGDSYLNDSGTNIIKLSPLSLTATGGIKAVDASVETESVGCVGVAFSDIANNSSGVVVTNGRLANSGIAFALASVLYVAKSSGLTNVKPEIGVNGFLAGDWVIKVGVVAKNLTNPSAKDILVNVSVIGQL
jgi:hypothetical protein